jgi:putative phosphoribosyl transferase
MAAFRDREDAGRQLAIRLEQYRNQNPLILGLPRGGVAVAREIARALNAPIDVIVARKLGAPWQPELGIGAVAPDDVLVLDEFASRFYPLPEEQIQEIARRERTEVERRLADYRGGKPEPEIKGRTVILVDDGLATGVTARAAIEWARKQNPRKIVFAAPVCAPSSADMLRETVEAVVCALEPQDFSAVGYWYDDFRQLEDEDVRRLLLESPNAPETAASSPAVQPVRFQVDSVAIDGDLAMPKSPIGIVLFAHGSGSSRHSKRNRYVAQRLNEEGIGTLLMDLLTASEEAEDSVTGHLRFDIPFQTERLLGATDYVRENQLTRNLPIGYFGASTGAAAALSAAARRPQGIYAVVSRGGRPDLAATELGNVKAPTLLIVGGSDHVVIPLNQQALARIRAEPSRIEIIPGATHLFEEVGALEEVARLSSEWFRERFSESVESRAA